MKWVADIEARLNALSPGRWECKEHDDGDCTVYRTHEGRIFATVASYMWPSDAAFVAHAPEDIAKLIAAVRFAQEQLNRIKHSGYTDVPVYGTEDALEDCRDIADKALAKLQSGEFGGGS